MQRIGGRGLASACVEGILASTAPYVAVMDRDLQHDERLLPRMLDTLKTEPAVVQSLAVAISSTAVSAPGADTVLG